MEARRAVVVEVAERMGCAYSGLAGIVEAQEEQLCVLVGEAKVGQNIPDCEWVSISHACPLRGCSLLSLLARGWTYTNLRSTSCLACSLFLFQCCESCGA